MVLPTPTPGFTFINLTTICYFSSDLTGFFMHIGGNTHSPVLDMAAPPNWWDFELWQQHQFRMHFFEQPQNPKPDALINTVYTLPVSGQSLFVYQQQKSQSNLLLQAGDATFFSWTSQGYDITLENSAGTICADGNLVVLKSSRCLFKCYPILTFYSSDVVIISTDNSRVLLVINGQIVVTNQLQQQQQKFIKRAIIDEQLLDDARKDPKAKFILYRYKYDMGKQVFHAAMLLNEASDAYIVCDVDSRSGNVTGIGLQVRSKLERPEDIKRPDPRFFILEPKSDTEAVLHCHQDPAKVIVADNEQLILGDVEDPNALKFNVKKAVQNIGYNDFISDDKPSNTCTNAARQLRARIFTSVLIIVFLLLAL